MIVFIELTQASDDRFDDPFGFFRIPHTNRRSASLLGRASKGDLL